MSIRTILWPTDFSDDSRHALEHAVAIARWYSARIIALHALSPSNVDVPVLAGGDHVSAADTCRGSLGADLKSAATGLETFREVVESSAVPAIVTYAAQNDVDLIVIGTHGAGGFEHLILGSVTEKVLRKAPCPVLTVPPRARATSSLPFKQIVCPTDFSRSSFAAMKMAFEFAQEGAAHLTLAHILEDPDENELFVPRAYDIHHHREARVKQVREHLEALVPQSVRDWTTTSYVVGTGKAYQEILRIADEERADLIVMGLQGRTPFDLMLFGSTTNQVVRRATCPVLTTRALE